MVFAGTDLGRSTLFVNAATGTVRAEPIAAGHVVYTMLTPDGKRAGFIDDLGTPGWFDIGADRSAGPIRRLTKMPGFKVYHNAPQDAAAISPDGRLMAVTFDGPLVWWNLDTGTKAELTAPAGTVNGIWISADNRTLLVKTDAGLGDFGLVAVDLGTGRSRTVVEPVKGQEFLMSRDRTAVVTCQRQGDEQVSYQLIRVSDCTALGSPYPTKSFGCGLVGLDATGHRILLKDDAGSLVDVMRGEKLSFGTQLPTGTTPVTDLISSGDKLVLASLGTAQITYTELPLGQRTLSVVTQVLTYDGTKTISLLKDGSLQLRPARNDDDRPLANREASNVVVIRETESLREVSRITTARPTGRPSASVDDYLVLGRRQPDTNFQYYFDHAGNLLTVSDTQVQLWNSRTGDQIVRWDSGAMQPPGGGDVLVGPYPAANQVTVIVLGNPVVRIVDLTTGRTMTTVEISPDVLGSSASSST